jgi:hypothetical protein
MVIRTCAYNFKAVKQISAVIVDLWNKSRLMAGTIDVIWSHLSRQRVLIGWH